jgi:hypothetical protein
MAPEFWPDKTGMADLLTLQRLETLEAEEVPMSDKPREWPNVAMDARDRAAEEAAAALKALEPLINDIDDVENLRRVGRAMNSISNVLRLLESVGAPTRP